MYVTGIHLQECPNPVFEGLNARFSILIDRQWFNLGSHFPWVKVFFWLAGLEWIKAHEDWAWAPPKKGGEILQSVTIPYLHSLGQNSILQDKAAYTPSCCGVGSHPTTDWGWVPGLWYDSSTHYGGSYFFVKLPICVVSSNFFQPNSIWICFLEQRRRHNLNSISPSFSQDDA